MKYVLALVFIGADVVFAAAPVLGLSSDAELVAFVAAVVAGCVSLLDVLWETARALRRLESDSRSVNVSLELTAGGSA